MLEELAKKYGTDKISGHSYIEHYTTHFADRKNDPVRLLEIGVGGYEDPDAGGASLRMWRDYFQNGKIHGIDIHKKNISEDRIHVHIGSQTDRGFLHSVVESMGGLDLVVDDGSHVNADVIATFQILFPLLSDNGIYVVEDTQTAYWKDYGGDFPADRGGKASGSSMEFFKMLTDGLNHVEFIKPGYEPTYFDKMIKSMHFYHNLLFIYAGPNTEPSNIVVDNHR
jgi:hypothetical protein